MGLSALASVDQLAALVQQSIDDNDPTADLMLDIASDMVRGALQQQIDLVTDDVIIVDPNRDVAMLPELPVVAVTKFETLGSDGAWSIIDPANYSVSKATGMVYATPNCGVSWPYLPGTWRITYTHGYDPIPGGIVGVVLGAAGRAYMGQLGVESERIGGYQVKYAMESSGFSPLEERALARYRVARVA